MIKSIAAKILSFLVGFFFAFAGVSKTSGLTGLHTSMSDEMQAGFKSGEWTGILGLPASFFLYLVGFSEFILGLLMLGFTVGLTSPMIAQWAASGAVFITLNATSAHVVRGDPAEKVIFCSVLCFLYTVLFFTIASVRFSQRNGFTSVGDASQ